MKKIYLDIETYSPVDLAKSNVYTYAADDGFKILLLAYALNDDPVTVIDIANGETLPTELIEAIKDPETLKIAHNAGFERVCLSKHLELNPGDYLEPINWLDTAVIARLLGYPPSLGKLADALEVEAKLAGTLLINYFSKPGKKGEQHSKTDNPQKWADFVEYNRRDVATLREIYRAFEHYLIFENYDFRKKEHVIDVKRLLAEYATSERINDRGFKIDIDLVIKMKTLAEAYKKRELATLQTLTNVENPNSKKQIKDWINANSDYKIDSLAKTMHEELLNKLEGKALAVFKQYLKTTTSASKKYDAFIRNLSEGDRIRGTFSFYGAGTTGRYAGRGVQPQNMPRAGVDDLNNKITMIKTGLTLEEFEQKIGIENINAFIRPCIIASENKTLIVADYSQIEARLLAYVTAEEWRINAFENGDDIYCRSAEQLYNEPITKDDKRRQVGKVMELACGYGGGLGALKNFGADKLGFTDAELKQKLNEWRKASPEIPALWRCCNELLEPTLDKAKRLDYYKKYKIHTYTNGNALIVLMPSKRKLHYLDLKSEIDNYTINHSYRSYTPSGAPTRCNIWGGILTNNIIQAIARDILTNAMLELETAGYKIVMHVHDEVVIETDDVNAIEDITNIMRDAVYFDKFKLPAEGWADKRYHK